MYDIHMSVAKISQCKFAKVSLRQIRDTRTTYLPKFSTDRAGRGQTEIISNLAQRLLKFGLS